ncbi:M23 family metallopeptidase (plasmid) [Oscillospiraceae bacterium MB08-C2-2]|nr:M23 family metallopeptidase [Oscillospiraceae bacterium MB08-C2-2]
MKAIIIKLLLSTKPNKTAKLVGIIAGIILGLLLFIVTVLGIVLVALVYIVNPQMFGDVSDNIHHQAIQEVKALYAIDNDLNLSYLIMVDLLADHSLILDKVEAAQFVAAYFVERHEEVIEVEVTVINEQGESETETEEEIIVYYLFLTESEIMQLVMSPPFSFGDSELEAMRNMIYSAPPSQNNPQDLLRGGKYPVPMWGNITSSYGWRIHPITGEKDFHTGIDIRGTWHDKIITIADGTVVQSSSDQWYGNFILIKHPEGFYSFYAHLSKKLVKVGDEVSQGQVIALEGGEPGVDTNVGYSTGHHLHFGIYASTSRSSHLDPVDYLYSKEEGKAA